MELTKTLKTVAVLAVALIIAGQQGLLSPVENFFIWVTKPVFVTARNIGSGIGNGFSDLFSIRGLQKENADLRQKVALLETENASLLTQLKDHGELEKALNLKPRTNYNLTGARIVSADPTSLNQTLFIDRGESSGMVVDQAVVDSAGAYVGRVTRVLNNTSEVTLISDVRSRIPAEVPQTGARGVLQGEHALSVSLAEVPQGQELPAGARIVTTGYTPGVPAGLLVGYVDKIYSRGGDLFQTSTVKPAADLRRLRVVFVITGKE